MDRCAARPIQRVRANCDSQPVQEDKAFPYPFIVHCGWHQKHKKSYLQIFIFAKANGYLNLLDFVFAHKKVSRTFMRRYTLDELIAHKMLKLLNKEFFKDKGVKSAVGF
jgi:hypothetical protein